MFNNVHGLYIVLIGYFLGTFPSKKEWLGVLLALLGCFCMIFDPSAARISSDPSGIPVQTSLVPALVDLGSAFFGALYFLMSAKNVKSMPICLLIIIMNIHTFFINGLLAKY